MNEALEALRTVLQCATKEAFHMGCMYGELQGKNAELRATIATLNEKLHSLQETD